MIIIIIMIMIVIMIQLLCVCWKLQPLYFLSAFSFSFICTPLSHTTQPQHSATTLSHNTSHATHPEHKRTCSLAWTPQQVAVACAPLSVPVRVPVGVHQAPSWGWERERKVRQLEPIRQTGQWMPSTPIAHRQKDDHAQCLGLPRAIGSQWSCS